jgi:D-arabinitol 2-dehydrogenase
MEANYRSPVEEEAARKAEELVTEFQKENPDADRSGHGQKDLNIWLISPSLPKVTAHYADVSSPESVDAAMAEILTEHGKIDNLITSAGFTENFEAINYPVDRVRKLWEVNVDGTYLFAIGVAELLME